MEEKLQLSCTQARDKRGRKPASIDERWLTVRVLLTLSKGSGRQTLQTRQREKLLLSCRQGNTWMQFSILDSSLKGKTNKNTAGKRSPTEGFCIQILLWMFKILIPIAPFFSFFSWEQATVSLGIGPHFCHVHRYSWLRKTPSKRYCSFCSVYRKDAYHKDYV